MLPPDLKSSNSLMRVHFNAISSLAHWSFQEMFYIPPWTCQLLLWEGPSIWSRVQQHTTPSHSMERVQILQLHPCKCSQYCLETTTECCSHKPSCGWIFGICPSTARWQNSTCSMTQVVTGTQEGVWKGEFWGKTSLHRGQAAIPHHLSGEGL